MSQNSLVLPTTGTVSGLQMTQNMNNALDTLNTLASGASAPGSPEAGQLWHDTTNNLLKLRDLANTTWIVLGAIDEANKLFNPSNNALATPQGRLTLASGTPIMNADATAQTSIYYTPYIGNGIAIYNGAGFINNAFSQLTLTLNTTNHLSSKLYDVFVFVNSGTLTLGAGPAWTNTTTRSAAITQLNGLWVNNASINLTNGSTTYSSIATNQATYVGTFYTTANGQTGVALRPAAAAGGTNNIIGLFNAYNRQRIRARCQDNTASWTYNVTAYRAANNSTSNRITYVDGLQTIAIEAAYNIVIAPNAQGAFCGVGIDSTTAPQDVVAVNNSSGSVQYNSARAELSSYPLLGLHYVQAMEATNNTNAATFYGTFSSTNMGLFLSTEI